MDFYTIGFCTIGRVPVKSLSYVLALLFLLRNDHLKGQLKLLFFFLFSLKYNFIEEGKIRNIPAVTMI